jgi:hypothetical protein
MRSRKKNDTQLTWQSWRLALVIVACSMLSACTTASWQRLFYDIGDQYACQRSGSLQRDAQARAAQCTDANHPDRTRFEDYEAARATTGTAGK